MGICERARSKNGYRIPRQSIKWIRFFRIYTGLRVIRLRVQRIIDSFSASHYRQGENYNRDQRTKNAQSIYLPVKIGVGLSTTLESTLDKRVLIQARDRKQGR